MTPRTMLLVGPFMVVSGNIIILLVVNDVVSAKIIVYAITAVLAVVGSMMAMLGYFSGLKKVTQ